MKNFLSRLSVNRWLFAIAISGAFYSMIMLSTYFLEAEAIKHESLKHFGGDISANLGLFEVLRSANFSYWYFSKFCFAVLILYLIISAYFMDYKNEPHVGWKRVYISAQILIPSLLALYFMAIKDGGYLYLESVSLGLLIFGIAEVVVLILIKFFLWVREGFAKSAN